MKISANRERVSVSMKHTHEIMESIRDRNVDGAINFLKLVMLRKASVPFRHYPSKGHKAGVPSGYPVKASKFIISLLNELKSNAKNSGGDGDKVVVSGYALGRGGYPRFGGGGVYRRGKRTNLRIFGMVEVVEKPKAAETPKAEGTKPTENAEAAGKPSEDTTKTEENKPAETPEQAAKQAEEKTDVTKKDN